MEDDLLLVVHLGYCFNDLTWLDKSLQKKYGKYRNYLKRIKRSIYARKNCMILLYEDDELPFEVPEKAEIIRDYGNGTREAIERLKNKQVRNIDICGEVLWWYVKTPKLEEITEMRKKLPKEKVKALEDLLDKKGKLDISDFTRTGIVHEKAFLEYLYSFTHSEDEVRAGCVQIVKDELKDFSVNIIRELCYPIKEPKQLNHEI